MSRSTRIIGTLMLSAAVATVAVVAQSRAGAAAGGAQFAAADAR